MKQLKLGFILASICIALSLTSCAGVGLGVDLGSSGSSGNPKPVPVSPYVAAAGAYTAASIAYEGVQTIIVDARAHGLVNDANWARFDQIQHAVAQKAPSVNSLLHLWHRSQQKPPGIDAALAELSSAVSDAQVIAGVGR